MRRPLSIVALCTFIAATALAPPVAAENADPETLFAEAGALMEQGRYAEALPKLEQAEKADPGIGTLFNIAVCQQNLGMLGSAYRNFRDVVQLARSSGKKAREDAARAKLDEVKAQAPAFTVRSLETGDVTIRIDGTALRPEDWAYYPVDSGQHKVEAIAPAKKPWSKMLDTPAGGTVEEIAVPKLEMVKDTKVVTVTTETTNGRRTLGFILGGVGIAGVVTATVTGILLLQDDSTAKEKCPDKICRNPDGTVNEEGADAVSRAKTLLPINAISWGVAAVGLGSGAFFLLTSGKKSSGAKATVVPVFAPGSGGAALSGRF